MRIEELNTASASAFVAALGGIYEHSAWVAERAARLRPFDDAGRLCGAMAGVVAAATPTEQLALIDAHPDLAGRLARAGSLASASASEQAGLGLDRLSDAQFDRFAALNAAYRARFGFPFIIAVRRHTRASVLAAFAHRLTNSRPVELQTALAEIDRIAAFRLDDLLADPVA